MKIEKKVWPKFFQAILEGRKKFESHLADWNIGEGDILVLREWDPEKKEYNGRSIEKEATYIVKTRYQKFWSKEEVEKFGFQVIGFK